MSTNEQPWDDETREFRGPTLGARILSFETQAEDRTRTGSTPPRLRPKRPTTLAGKRLLLDEMAVRMREDDRRLRLQRLGLLPGPRV